MRAERSPSREVKEIFRSDQEVAAPWKPGDASRVFSTPKSWIGIVSRIPGRGVRLGCRRTGNAGQTRSGGTPHETFWICAVRVWPNLIPIEPMLFFAAYRRSCSSRFLKTYRGGRAGRKTGHYTRARTLPLRRRGQRLCRCLDRCGRGKSRMRATVSSFSTWAATAGQAFAVLRCRRSGAIEILHREAARNAASFQRW